MNKSTTNLAEWETIDLAQAESEAETGEETQAPGPEAEQTPEGLNNITYIVYGVMLLYLLYMFYKSWKSKKNIDEVVATYGKKQTFVMNLLLVVILALGVSNLALGNYLIGALMVAIAILFFFMTREKIIIANNGIYGDNQFFTWDEIKRWQWDISRGDLVIVTKEFGKSDQTHFMRLGKEHINEVNDHIREYKLGKTPPSKKKNKKNS